MKKFTLTTVDKLSPGDQFLKEGDKLKIVYTVSERQKKSKVLFYVQKGDNRFPDLTNINEQIIYLGKKKNGNV